MTASREASQVPMADPAIEKGESSPPGPAHPPNSPPNGGIGAWLQVVGSWFMVFNTMGMHYST